MKRTPLLQPLIIPVYQPKTPEHSPPPRCSPQEEGPPFKRMRWDLGLKDECNNCIEKIHRTTQSYASLRLVAKVLVHIADGTESSSAAMHSIEMMREMF